MNGEKEKIAEVMGREREGKKLKRIKNGKRNFFLAVMKVPKSERADRTKITERY